MQSPPDAAAIASYHKDGVLFPFEGLDPATTVRMRDALIRSCEEEARIPSEAGRRQASARVKPYLLFPWAAELVRNKVILDAVEAVIGPDIMVFHTTIWWKKAGSEGFVPWHQDATYFGLAPHEHVTAWVALTDSTPDAGCVRLLPGSHRAGQLPHHDAKDPRLMLSRGQSVVAEIDESKTIEIELKAGQFSLHDTLALHASAPNRSTGDRIGVGISYIPARVRHIGETRLSATLVRGIDRYGHFDLEAAPAGEADPIAIATHADSIARFWTASESIPEMALVH